MVLLVFSPIHLVNVREYSSVLVIIIYFFCLQIQEQKKLTHLSSPSIIIKNCSNFVTQPQPIFKRKNRVEISKFRRRYICA